MTFSEAVKCMEEGQKVKRLSWGFGVHTHITIEEYMGDICFMLNGQFSEYKYDDHSVGKIIYDLSYEDVTTNDWIIYE